MIRRLRNPNGPVLPNVYKSDNGYTWVSPIRVAVRPLGRKGRALKGAARGAYCGGLVRGTMGSSCLATYGNERYGQGWTPALFDPRPASEALSAVIADNANAHRYGDVLVYNAYGYTYALWANEDVSIPLAFWRA